MALDPLALDTDVTDRIGRALTASETSRLPALLRDASAVVRSRRVTGQEFTASTSTVRQRILRDHVVLPQRPVTAVNSVTHPDTGLPVTRYRWNGESFVYVFLWNPESDFEMPWRPGFDVVDVEYDHGYEEIPDDVIAVVSNMVIRALGMPPDESTTVLERIEGYEYRRAEAAVAGVIGILPDEIAQLRPYSAGSKSRTVRLL